MAHKNTVCKRSPHSTTDIRDLQNTSGDSEKLTDASEEIADGYDKVTKEEICEAAMKLSVDKIYMLEAVESEVESVED